MEHYLVSARKYRPATFESVVGQKALTATLKNAIAQNRLAHSYLFCGSRGVGKTSCARIFAKTINCEHPGPDGEACNECASCRAFNDGNSMNIIELDAASNNGVDAMHDLIEQVQVPPTQGRYRVFIVDEVHMLSTAAFNAFLKTLEEPPAYVVFILATTEKHKILPTILSRCQIYDFNRITIADMVEHLAFVARQEGMNAEQPALTVIARKADGAMRDALSIFDQVAASTRGNITYAATIDNLNVLDNAYYDRLLDAFVGCQVLKAWQIYKEIRDKGFDSHFFLNGLTSYMRDLMVAFDPSTLPLIDGDDEIRKAMAAAAAKCDPRFIYRALCLLNDADLNYRVASNKQFLVEITLAKICQLLSPSPDDSGQGEGQLKPIERPAAPHQQSHQQPQPAAVATNIPPTTTPTAQANAAPMTPPARPSQPRPRPQQPVRLGIGPSLSIKKGVPQSEQQQSVPNRAGASVHRESPYTHEALMDAWKAFADANPHAHILVNTMRACRPEPAAGDTFTVTVENEMQRDTMHNAMPALLQTVHDRLSNDNITFNVEINQGESAPYTWNERDLLAHMVESHPALKDFITDLKLKL